jgi:hypothetical protein
VALEGAVKLVHLTLLILEINAALDTGKYQDVTLDEVEDHIEQGDLFPYLRTRLGDNVDLSLFDEPKARDITMALQEVHSVGAGVERRKWGIENNGLNLLIAWINELIKMRRWQD